MKKIKNLNQMYKNTFDLACFYQSIDWILPPLNGKRNDLLYSSLIIPTELTPLNDLINNNVCPSLENLGNWLIPLDVNLVKLSVLVDIK